MAIVLKQKTLTDQIREAIIDSGQTQYAICKATGIDPAIMSRFMHRKSFMEESRLNALAGAIGIQITATKQKQVKHGMAGKAKR